MSGQSFKEVVVFEGSKCQQHFVTARMIRLLAVDAGRTVVALVNNERTGATKRGYHEVEADWHDLNEGGDEADLHVDLTQPGVALFIIKYKNTPEKQHSNDERVCGTIRKAEKPGMSGRINVVVEWDDDSTGVSTKWCAMVSDFGRKSPLGRRVYAYPDDQIVYPLEDETETE